MDLKSLSQEFFLGTCRGHYKSYEPQCTEQSHSSRGTAKQYGTWTQYLLLLLMPIEANLIAYVSLLRYLLLLLWVKLYPNKEFPGACYSDVSQL